jgi:hypothetical protein
VVPTGTGEPFRLGIVERERVEGEVVRLQRERGIQRRCPRRERGAGDVVEEVEADRADPGIAGRGHGRGDVLGVVAAADRTELGGIE